MAISLKVTIFIIIKLFKSNSWRELFNKCLIFYYDENGNEFTNFAGSGFTNSAPYEQQITAKIEDPNNASCAIEVNFSLKTISPPEIELLDSYEICSLGESLELKSNPIYSSWN